MTDREKAMIPWCVPCGGNSWQLEYNFERRHLQLELQPAADLLDEVFGKRVTITWVADTATTSASGEFTTRDTEQLEPLFDWLLGDGEMPEGGGA